MSHNVESYEKVKHISEKCHILKKLESNQFKFNLRLTIYLIRVVSF